MGNHEALESFDQREGIIRKLVKEQFAKLLLILGIGNVLALFAVGYTVLQKAETAAEEKARIIASEKMKEIEKGVHSEAKRLEDQLSWKVQALIETLNEKITTVKNLPSDLVAEYSKALAKVYAVQGLQKDLESDLEELRGNIDKLKGEETGKAAQFVSKFEVLTEKERTNLLKGFDFKALQSQIRANQVALKKHTKSDVNQYALSGYIYRSKENAGWNLGGENGQRLPRETVVKVTFKRPFQSLPQVITSLRHIDSRVGIYDFQRMEIIPKEVTKEGFNLVFRTWEDNDVHGLGATWLAIGN